jgi:hypothetical protein
VWKEAAMSRWGASRLKTTQRNIALRLCKAYRTVSANAIILLSGFLPLELRAQELSDLYQIKQSGHTDIIGYPGDNYQKPRNYNKSMHPAKRYCAELMNFHERPSQLQVFTDGSKDADAVGAGFVVFRDDIIIKRGMARLAHYCSVFQAELCGVRIALEWINNSQIENTAILLSSDSKAAIGAIMDRNSCNPLVLYIHQLIFSLKTRDFSVVFKAMKWQTI